MRKSKEDSHLGIIIYASMSILTLFYIGNMKNYKVTYQDIYLHFQESISRHNMPHYLETRTSPSPKEQPGVLSGMSPVLLSPPLELLQGQ